MNIESIFSIIGGLGLFFFGMKTMSKGLKKSAGEGLRKFLHAVTKHRIYGVFAGALTTLFVQSSSVTTVFVVGFVNASLINLRQAITLIMGANIGTTFTAWLVSAMSLFKVTNYALPAIGIGFGLNAWSKIRSQKNLGQVLLGFGLLFIGLDYMKDAFGPLKGSEFTQEIFMTFGANPLMGVLVGIIFTVLLQSSSATIAIVQLMAFNGLLSFESAVPIILGDNIGTTVTAQMAAIGTNLNARRAAMAHTIFNVVGTAYMLFFVYTGMFQSAISWLLPGEISTTNVMVYIALAHSFFNVINTIVFLPFVSVLEKLSIWLVPKRGDVIDYSTQYLEEHLLKSPGLALEQVYNEISYMIKVARKAVNNAVNGFLKENVQLSNQADEYESVTDNLQEQITSYIVRVSQKKLDADQSKEVPILIHHVNDLERIGDRAQQIVEITRRQMEDRLTFAEESKQEIQKLLDELLVMFDNVETAFKNKDHISAERVLSHAKNVKNFHRSWRDNHIKRLDDTKKMASGFLFLEIIDCLSNISGALSNIAESVILDNETNAARHLKQNTFDQ